ncbi:MAG: DUF3307 domain-containing protein [Anaerolineae bacterium]|nr:DUF3307 domain-containing protein [Anaerolineae bacterium]
MITVMLLAHLLGDYIFQWGVIARWKSQSLSGVLAHGCIVTLSALACTGLTAPAWWPYALLIGLSHTAIDVVRARLIHTTSTRWELVGLLLDQGIHVLIIVALVALTGDPLAGRTALAPGLSGARHVLSYAPAAARPQPSTPLSPLADPRLLRYVVGYLLLAQPAWVLIRFLVRGLWGADAAPPLDHGEKFGPMVERMAIATFTCSGMVLLTPLVLLPRRLMRVTVSPGQADLAFAMPQHWAETFISIALAVGIGLVLRGS